MIRPIQYLRAIAALMVVWHHGIVLIPAVESVVGSSGFGASGVDLFFVISGFIMVASTHGKDITPKEFMVRRITRVVPLYWCATLLMVGKIVFTKGPLTTDAVAKSLFFVPYDSLMHPGNVWPILVPGWTLNYEMFFYVLFALSLIVRYRLASLMSSIGFLVLVGAVLPTSGAIETTYTSPILLEFLSGAVIATGWLRGMRLSLPASLILIALGAGSLAMRDYLPEMPSQLIGASLIVVGSLNTKFCAMNVRPLLLLGDASYSIYLTHAFTLIPLEAAWTHAIHHNSVVLSIMFMGAALALSALAGIAAYRLIERPLTKWLQSPRRAMTAIVPQSD
jgi:exopolysaccharide production protein ExoZ